MRQNFKKLETTVLEEDGAHPPAYGLSKSAVEERVLLQHDSQLSSSRLVWDSLIK